MTFSFCTAEHYHFQLIIFDTLAMMSQTHQYIDKSERGRGSRARSILKGGDGIEIISMEISAEFFDIFGTKKRIFGKTNDHIFKYLKIRVF